MNDNLPHSPYLCDDGPIGDRAWQITRALERIWANIYPGQAEPLWILDLAPGTHLDWIDDEVWLYRAVEHMLEACEDDRSISTPDVWTAYIRETTRHHIRPLADGGDDTIENVACLCPAHHREAHMGKARETIYMRLLEVRGQSEAMRHHLSAAA